MQYACPFTNFGRQNRRPRNRIGHTAVVHQPSRNRRLRQVGIVIPGTAHRRAGFPGRRDAARRRCTCSRRGSRCRPEAGSPAPMSPPPTNHAHNRRRKTQTRSGGDGQRDEDNRRNGHRLPRSSEGRHSEDRRRDDRVDREAHHLDRHVRSGRSAASRHQPKRACLQDETHRQRDQRARPWMPER